MSEEPPFDESGDYAGAKRYRPLLRCFSPVQADLLREVLTHRNALPDPVRHNLLRTFSQAAGVLVPLVQSVRASPVYPGENQLSGRERSLESLIESLCREDDLPLELAMPTGAHARRTLVVARLNFFKGICYSLEPCADAGCLGLLDRVRDCVDEGIFCMLGDELLMATLLNATNSDAIRRAAARRLVNLWSDSVDQPVAAFPSVLLSAWRARRKVRATFGTLFGTSELMSLVSQEVDEAFVRFFTNDDATPDLTEAFREFLFALPFEELQELQVHMRETGIPVLSANQVFQIVRSQRRPRAGGPDQVPSAEEVYASYRRRRVRAEYRLLARSPGPHKTAEGYIMEFLLNDDLPAEEDPCASA